MKFKLRNIFLVNCLLAGLFSTFSVPAVAQAFALSGQDNVVGAIRTSISKPGDNLAQIARDNDMGYTELEEANPGIDPDNVAPGSVVVIPSQFILPNTPHDGIVVNLAEMRLYYYPKGQNRVVTYPIGIGREGEDTPIGVLRIIQRIPNPTWYSPESIRKSRAAQGVIIPKVVPPGPDNPLGKFAMRLSNPNYLIHGTNDPLGGIGRRSSSGCLRLYPEDIDPLFHAVTTGTNVYIINEPYKAGWALGKLYLESHVALQKDNDKAVDDSAQIKNIVQMATKSHAAQIDWPKALTISKEEQGIPQVIGGLS